ESLRDTAVDLAFDLRRIDRTSDIVGCVNLDDSDRTELEIDLDLRHLRGEAVRRIRHALPVLVEGRGRGIEEAFAHGDIAVLVRRQRREIDALVLPVEACRESRAI